MMRSLRGRLIVGLLALVLIAGAVTGVVVFRWAYNEALEIQDAVLVQVGKLAVGNTIAAGHALEHGFEAEDRLVVEELHPQARTVPDIPVLPLPTDVRDGLETVGRGRNQWRVFVGTRSDGSRVVVGQLTAYRAEIAHGSALRAVVPYALLVPCLMLLIGIVISYSFAPVSRLAVGLDASDHDHLADLPLKGIPEELQPFIQSINRLLGRIAAILEQQRRFVADAAHELRSPITALSVQADNLDHADLPPESRRRFAALQTGIRRTSHLLEQLLTLARYDNPGAAEPQVTAFDQIVRGVVANLLPLAQRRTVDLGFERIESVLVRSDATALYVLARNLIDNALRYTPDGGRVDLYLYAEGKNAIFRVEDTGSGIGAADLPRIFEPFYRGRSQKGEGTGLGLSIVDRIVRQAKGAVAATNVSGPDRHGLQVVVTLPLAEMGA